MIIDSVGVLIWLFMIGFLCRVYTLSLLVSPRLQVCHGGGCLFGSVVCLAPSLSRCGGTKENVLEGSENVVFAGLQSRQKRDSNDY